MPDTSSGAEDWVDVVFRGQRVKARATAAGALLVGKDGFVEFTYQPNGKRYKSRPESFERVEGATIERRAVVPVETSSTAATGKASRPGASTSRSRVVGKGGGGKVVDPSMRRGPEAAVQLWTDGACSGNPGPAGVGVHGEYRGEAFELSEYLGEATNNIAELTAILRGLELATERFGADHPVDLMTDSEYCLGLLALGWKAKANQELVARMRARFDAMADVLLVKVKGHAGVPGNERADELARQAITSRRTSSGKATPVG